MKETAADGIGIHCGGDSTVNTVQGAACFYCFLSLSFAVSGPALKI